MSRFASWQPPRLSTVMMVLLPTLVIVLIGAGIVHHNPPPGKTLPVHSASRATVPAEVKAARIPSAPVATKPSAPPAAEFSPMGKISLDAATRQNITAAVRIWAAFPNREGPAATLAKLRLNSSVSSAALQDLARQWARPLANPVSVTLGDVVIYPLPSFASGARATLTGTVVQHKLYSDGKVTTVLTSVNVWLAKVGDAWQIARLVAL